MHSPLPEIKRTSERLAKEAESLAELAVTSNRSPDDSGLVMQHAIVSALLAIHAELVRLNDGGLSIQQD